MSLKEKHRSIKKYLWDKWTKSRRYKNYVVELDKYDVQGAKEIAARRYQVTSDEMAKNPNVSGNGPAKDASRDSLGALGEIAVIKWLRKNGYEASMESFTDTTSKLGKEDRFDTDFVFDGQNISVEIKTTEKPINSKLIYPLYKGKRKQQPDLFILVTQIDEDKYCIKGFATKDEILSNIDDSLPTEAFAIHEKDLDTNILKTLNKIKDKDK